MMSWIQQINWDLFVFMFMVGMSGGWILVKSRNHQKHTRGERTRRLRIYDRDDES